MKTYIYTLSDKNGVRYIGKSNDPNYRFRKHINESKLKRTRKEKWIYSLLQKNELPELNLLDIVPVELWSFYESYWISQFKAWGFNIVNGTDGGEGSNGFKGKKHTKETKEKCRIAALSRKTETRMLGTTNGSNVLTEQQVKEIRKINKNYSTRKLAKMFKVSKTTISKIIHRESWKHI